MQSGCTRICDTLVQDGATFTGHYFSLSQMDGCEGLARKIKGTEKECPGGKRGIFSNLAVRKLPLESSHLNVP